MKILSNRIFKLSLILGLTVFLFESCSTQKDITKVSIEEIIERVDFDPEFLQMTLPNGLIVEITPVSANEMNSYFGSLSQLDGEYNFKTVKHEREDLTMANDSKKETTNNLITRLKALDNYCEKLDIPEEEKEILISRTIELFGNSEEKEYLYNQVNKNPFFIDNKYLSIFKIQLSNPGDKKLVFNSDEISVISGQEILQPYSQKMLKSYHNDIDNHILIDRCNLPEKVSIYPGETTVRYFSIPPINKKVSKLKIYIKDVASEYQVNHIIEKIEENIQYLRLHTSNSYCHLVPIMHSEKDGYKILSTEYRDIFIPEEMINKKLDLFILSKTTSSFSVVCKKDMKISDYLQSEGTLGKVEFLEYEKLLEFE